MRQYFQGGYQSAASSGGYGGSYDQAQQGYGQPSQAPAQQSYNQQSYGQRKFSCFINHHLFCL